MKTNQKKETWVISRGVKEIEEELRKETPTKTRERALAMIADRLGEAKSWDQKANNAFVYYTLPTFTSFIMAFEKRMNQLIGNVRATISGCSEEGDCKKECKEDCIIGRSIIIEGGIFESTNTLSEWVMNFFQQSPSIGGLARENQVEIAKAGYSQVAMTGHQMTPTKIDTND